MPAATVRAKRFTTHLEGAAETVCRKQTGNAPGDLHAELTCRAEHTRNVMHGLLDDATKYGHTLSISETTVLASTLNAIVELIQQAQEVLVATIQSVDSDVTSVTGLNLGLTVTTGVTGQIATGGAQVPDVTRAACAIHPGSPVNTNNGRCPECILQALAKAASTDARAST